MKALVLLLLYAAFVSGINETFRVLVLIPFNARSHKNMFNSIVSSLAERGNQVHVVSMFKSEEFSANPNVSETVLTVGPNAPNIIRNIADKVFSGSSSHPFVGFINTFQHLPGFCEHLLSLDEVRTLLRKSQPGDYQVVLLDAFVCECFLPLAHLVNAPLVQVAPSHLMPWNYEALGTSIDYTQDAVFFLGHTDRKSWLERAEAAVLGHAASLLRDWMYLPRLQRVLDAALLRELGPERAARVPPLWDVEEARTALVLVNWHWSLGAFVRENPPTLVQVAGMHCREAKPLPQDLERFVAGAGEHGFVLFSLGSSVPGHKLPVPLRHALLAAFAALPQRVIWKFESPLDHLPDNVMMVPWLPQQDLLGDRRLRVFVTQAGMLSMQEAVWHGAPVLALPLMVDQVANAALARRAGLGLELNLLQATEHQLRDAIAEVTSNQSYRQTARRMAVLMRDVPEDPRARAVWWVEYVARHGGTRHLRPPQLSWAQRHLLDVVLPALTVALLVGIAGTKCWRRRGVVVKTKIN